MRYFLVSILFSILSIQLFSQTSGKVSASLNYQKGNTEVMALTGKLDIDHKFSEQTISSLFLQTNYAEQFGQVFDRVYKGSFELNVDDDDFYPLAFISAENNLNRRIELRLNGGVGGGYHDALFTVDCKTSLMVLWEYSDMVGIEPISTPILSARTRLKRKLDNGVSVRFTYIVQKYLTSPVYRTISTFSMICPIYNSLSFVFTGENRYETVQVQGVKPNDFSTMFGLEFGI